MQIHSGKFKGAQISVSDQNGVRPTLIRSRVAMFDSLGPLKNKIVFDFFAGSGALGLEAASRGAEKVVFFEKNTANCRNLLNNIENLKKNYSGSSPFPDLTVKKNNLFENSESELNSDIVPDLIFSDPPYDISGELFADFCKRRELSKKFYKSTLIWEIPSEAEKTKLFLNSGEWKLKDRRKFGKTVFHFLVNKQKISKTSNLLQNFYYSV